MNSLGLIPSALIIPKSSNHRSPLLACMPNTVRSQRFVHVRSNQQPDSIQGVLEQLRQDPVLRKVLDSPKMQRVLNEVQANPAAAMERYGGDKEVMGVLAKLTTFDMSPEQKQAIQGMGASPEDLAQTIYSNRQLAATLQRPHVRGALAEFRTNPVAAFAKYEGNQEIMQVLDLLEKSLSIEV